MASYHGRSCHLAVKVNQGDRPSSGLSVNHIVEKVKELLKSQYRLVVKTDLPLDDGSMVVLSKDMKGGQLDNQSLNGVVRVYSKTNVISINLEECVSENDVVPSLESGDDAIQSNWLTNANTEKFRSDLSDAVGLEVERIPLLKRAADVPLFFTSSDDRIFEYDFDKQLFCKRSEFQLVRIFNSPTLGRTLILDDLQNLAEADIQYTHGLMHYGHHDYKDKEILILGGGDGGLLHELLKEKPKRVTMVDIDKIVVDSCRQYLRKACGDVLDTFQGPNYEIIIGDCVKFMEESIQRKQTYDIVFNDLTDIPLSSESTRVGSNLWSFVRRILILSLECLRPNGRYFNHAIGLGCEVALKSYENLLKNLPTPVEFSRHSAFIPSFLEEWVFYEIWFSQMNN